MFCMSLRAGEIVFVGTIGFTSIAFEMFVFALSICVCMGVGGLWFSAVLGAIFHFYFDLLFALKILFAFQKKHGAR